LLASRVSKIAHRHTEDIDESKRSDAREMERLGFIAAERAKDALKEPLPGYDELQRFILEEVINSMQVTHRTIIAIFSNCEGKPETVDTLTLARAQLEGLYTFCLMLESPQFIDLYLKDGWKKRYVDLLLQQEEMKNLPRFDEFNKVLGPKFLEEGRTHYRITDIEKLTIDHEQLGILLPAGVKAEKIKPFPTPGKAINETAQGDRRRMLERLYPEYCDLSSFAHGLPSSNLLKGLLSPGSLHRRLFTEEQAKDSSAKDVTERAFIVSLMSIIQCAAELIEKYPADVNLVAGVVQAWKSFSEDTLLGKTIWGIRTRRLLAVIG
jgi:hypothetical protein